MPTSPLPTPVVDGRVDTASLSPRLLAVLSLCAGAAVANLYYAQPLLAMMGRELDAPTHAGWIAVATQVGYTLGIAFVLPLGDLLDRRQLTLAIVAVLACAWLGCALAPGLNALVVASVLVGFGSVVTQIMVPLAADLAAPAQRARAVGVVFSGILAGILLARTLSGAVGQWLGWRAMFAIAALLALGLGGLIAATLPRLKPKTSQPYPALLASMWHLFRRHRSLQLACAIQACVFAVFSAFWSVLALHLAQPPFELGAAAAGAFGLVGLVGVLAANRGGRVIDRVGPRHSLLFGLLCCVLAFVLFAADDSVRGLIVGVVLLDLGLSVANVANQSRVMGLEPEARSRINTLYVTSMFLGGASGSAAASAAWAARGWPAVCGIGLFGAALGLLIHLLARPRAGR
ncbi:MAG: MFS transporter [Leptothrix sp. (in: b-proteobacteria)]